MSNESKQALKAEVTFRQDGARTITGDSAACRKILEALDNCGSNRPDTITLTRSPQKEKNVSDMPKEIWIEATDEEKISDWDDVPIEGFTRYINAEQLAEETRGMRIASGMGNPDWRDGFNDALDEVLKMLEE